MRLTKERCIGWQHKRDRGKRRDRGAGGSGYRADADFDVASLIRPHHDALRAELARMLGGNERSEISLAHARELLSA